MLHLSVEYKIENNPFFWRYLFYVVIKIIFILFVMINDCHICRKPYKVDRPHPSQEDFHSRDCHP